MAVEVVERTIEAAVAVKPEKQPNASTDVPVRIGVVRVLTLQGELRSIPVLPYQKKLVSKSASAFDKPISIRALRKKANP